jgi:DNA-binding NarL/FixJ family response regulator
LHDVLRHVALGKSKDIAAALDISEETVKTHVRHMLAKLGAVAGISFARSRDI